MKLRSRTELIGRLHAEEHFYEYDRQQQEQHDLIQRQILEFAVAGMIGRLIAKKPVHKDANDTELYSSYDD